MTKERASDPRAGTGAEALQKFGPGSSCCNQLLPGTLSAFRSLATTDTEITGAAGTPVFGCSKFERGACRPELTEARRPPSCRKPTAAPIPQRTAAARRPMEAL